MLPLMLFVLCVWVALVFGIQRGLNVGEEGGEEVCAWGADEEGRGVGCVLDDVRDQFRGEGW